MSIPNVGSQRPLVVQQFLTRPINVAAAALPIDPNQDKNKLVTSFAISNPVGGISVFIGNAGITAGGANSGFEIPSGTAPLFAIDQQGRQLYEIQSPLLDIAAGMQCKNMTLDGLPFVVWDLSQFYIIAAAPQTVTLITFPTMYL